MHILAIKYMENRLINHRFFLFQSCDTRLQETFKVVMLTHLTLENFINNDKKNIFHFMTR